MCVIQLNDSSEQKEYRHAARYILIPPNSYYINVLNKTLAFENKRLSLLSLKTTRKNYKL